jgi:3-deoxy-D-manno-octulosonate 8-phosphate phosphatase (KDO 8-P phosphatase)
MTFEKLVKHYNLKSKEVAFIGDDINDLVVFKIAGLSVCPCDTFDYIKDRVDLVTNTKGGRGVLREVADLVLAARGEFEI